MIPCMRLVSCVGLEVWVDVGSTVCLGAKPNTQHHSVEQRMDREIRCVPWNLTMIMAPRYSNSGWIGRSTVNLGTNPKLQHDGYEQWMMGGSIVFLGTVPYYSTMVSSSGWLEISTVSLGLVSRAT
jgi:hypothetical protein